MDATCPCRSGAWRRRSWLRALLLGVVTTAGADLHDPLDARIVVGPYLRDVTSDGMTVAWETRSAERTAVEFGPEEPLAHRVEEAGRTRFHAVRLTGLSPAHPILYRVAPAHDDPGGPASPTCRAQLDRGPDHPVTFAVVGDTQDQCGAWGAIAERIRAERPAFVLHVGDIVEEGGDAGRWQWEFFRPARRLLSTTPLWAVLGNHEADSSLYYRYFGGPAPGWRQTFVFGDAQFFLVDSERDLSPGSAQHAWLDETLTRSRSRWRFVAVHRPPFTSDRDEYRDTSRGEGPSGDPRTKPLVPLLEAHHVDVVFCGHVHAYERSRPLREGRVDEGGVVYVQTGGGGGRLEESADTRSWHAAALRRCHHYVSVSLSGETMELRAYDEEGRLFDVATRRSHKHRGSLDAGAAVTLQRRVLR